MLSFNANTHCLTFLTFTWDFYPWRGFSLLPEQLLSCSLPSVSAKGAVRQSIWPPLPTLESLSRDVYSRTHASFHTGAPSACGGVYLCGINCAPAPRAAPERFLSVISTALVNKLHTFPPPPRSVHLRPPGGRQHRQLLAPPSARWAAGLWRIPSRLDKP